MKQYMSSPIWITSLSCSSTVVQSLEDTAIFQWLRFIFLSPCPQIALLFSIDTLFLLVLLAFALKKLYDKFKSHHNNSVTGEPHISFLEATLWFKVSLVVTVVLALSWASLSILSFITITEFPWKLIDGFFWLLHAVTYVVIVILLVHDKRFEALTHPMSLRIYGVLNFITTSLFTTSGIIRLISVGETQNPSLRFDDIFSFIALPLSLVLLVVAIRGFTVTRESESVMNVETNLYESLLHRSSVSGFASASMFSKALWLWMNPLLSKGYKAPLKIDEIPSLSPQHRAERMSELFAKNWPKPHEKSKHPVVYTLLWCFWDQIAITAFLAIVRLFVMFIGPMLIQGFVDYTSGKRSSPYEGYYLVLILLIAKIVEVTSTHHFNFNSQKLGMLIRSTLTTSLYKKGLRLSSSARQAHGVGQIVNYLAVDAQQLSNMMLQLHAVWLMPLQVAVAVILLYIYLGASVITTIIGLLGVFAFAVVGMQRNNLFQYNSMKKRDSRMKAMNEMLSNMRVIKFQAWEKHFSKRIQSFRDEEFGWLTKFLYSISGNMAVMWFAPVLITTLTFGSAILLGVQLDVGTVFTTSTIIKILQEPIWNFPQSMISISQAIISFGRLDGFMTSRELADESEESCGDTIAVEVEDGVFSWDDESGEQVLKISNLVIKKGELVAVVGTVGSGKSSFLASILGEMPKISGKVRVCGTTAYVAQTSWIQNETIQDNILFGLPMNREKYREVSRVCCLEKDLEMMESGDQTEIGERGINLSGGQKQRIQLARAVYQDCDIYLLDDVFSAVDAQTGSEIFKECVKGALKNKTILLVTHQVDFLHNVDLILVMRDGVIVQAGKYNDLLESSMDFKALVVAHETSMELVAMGATLRSENSIISSISPTYENKEANGENGLSKFNKGMSKLIDDEQRETGNVNLHVYKLYCTEAFGWWGAAGVLLVSLLMQASLMAGDYWLAYETSEKHAMLFDASFFISIYAIIAAVACMFILLRTFSITILGLKTAQIFFSGILHSILRAPMSFFDTTPSGRILSRSSTDQTNVDVFLPLYMGLTIAMYSSLLSIIIITCQNSWPTVFLLIPLGWLNIWYQGYYLSTSRELTRLDSITKAPIIHHFSESISGIMTIRCFRKQGRFCEENLDLVNANLRMDFHNNGSNEWLGFRLELIGSVFLCISTLFMILLPSSIIKPGTDPHLFEN